jgi:uncharacterized protein
LIWLTIATVVSALLVWLAVKRSVRVRINEREMRLECRSLPEKGLEVLHVSDLHISRNTLWRLEAVARTARREWDLVLLSGDFAEEPEGIEPVAESLGRLRARYGVWAVLGNHDYYHYRADTPVRWLQVLLGSFRHGRCDRLSLDFGVEDLVSALERRGIRVLRNEFASGRIEGGGDFQVFGLDDPVTGHDNPRLLYGKDDPAALRLALTHAPTHLALLRPLNPHLVFCGHTHGGQIRLPFMGAVSTGSEAPRRAAAGLVRQDGLNVHISPGAGAGVVFPWRFAAPAEITVIRLVPFSPAQRDKLENSCFQEAKP